MSFDLITDSDDYFCSEKIANRVSMLAGTIAPDVQQEIDEYLEAQANGDDYELSECTRYHLDSM